MPTKATERCSRRHLYRVLVAIVALIFSGAVGAGTTIKTIVAYDHLACRQFLDMVKAAGVPEMSDAQLCDFRFERLPPSVAKHFTAIDWKSLEVKDPVAMYRRMRMANVIEGFQLADRPPWPNLMKAASEAVADHNLGFYSAQVQLQGRGPKVTVVKMDVKRGCTKLPSYMQHMGLPFYAIYKGPALRRPWPVVTEADGLQMMLWKNKGLDIPVLLSTFSHWVPPLVHAPADYFNQIVMNSLAPTSNVFYRGAIHNYGVCGYNLMSPNKPNEQMSKTKEPRQ